jgi:aerobic carbon-monoxide dehydrogenase medium subunit
VKPAPFTYHAPDFLEDALAILGDTAGDDGRILAGGQSLVPMMALRLAEPAHLVDINRIAELDHVAMDGDTLSIGALVRHERFQTLETQGVLGQLLRDVSVNIAHLPIRLRGTFCGSLANADPASEWCLAAVTLDARITARRRSGSRIINAVDFFKGVMTTALAPDEILTSVEFSAPPRNTQMGFYEFNRRAGDFALAMGLVSYRVEDGAVVEPRIGLGGVEAYPRRIAEAEQVLAGQVLAPDVLHRVADSAASAIEPLVDFHTNTAYRRDLARTVILRAFARAADKGCGDG